MRKKEISFSTDITQNPGYRLFVTLTEIFPFNPKNEDYIRRIDDSFMTNESYSFLNYKRAIYYVLKRLIYMGDYIKKKFDVNSYPSELYMNEIRKNLRYKMGLPQSKIEEIHTFLIDSLRERGKSLSDGKKNAIISNAMKNRHCCYICGKELIFNHRGYDQDHPDLVEVEHIWPKSLGGSNALFNLDVSCAWCNRAKNNSIDEADTHFENIFITHNKGEDNFNFEFQKEYKIATYLKGGTKCYSCNRQAIDGNIMHFGRASIDDNWHFLNINTYCQEHIKE